eukprot:s1946_g2.t1
MLELQSCGQISDRLPARRVSATAMTEQHDGSAGRPATAAPPSATSASFTSLSDVDSTVLAYAQWLSELQQHANQAKYHQKAELEVLRDSVSAQNVELNDFKRHCMGSLQQIQQQVSDLKLTMAEVQRSVSEMKIQVTTTKSSVSEVKTNLEDLGLGGDPFSEAGSPAARSPVGAVRGSPSARSGLEISKLYRIIREVQETCGQNIAAQLMCAFDLVVLITDRTSTFSAELDGWNTPNLFIQQLRSLTHAARRSYSVWQRQQGGRVPEVIFQDLPHEPVRAPSPELCHSFMASLKELIISQAMPGSVFERVVAHLPEAPHPHHGPLRHRQHRCSGLRNCSIMTSWMASPRPHDEQSDLARRGASWKTGDGSLGGGVPSDSGFLFFALLEVILGVVVLCRPWQQLSTKNKYLMEKTACVHKRIHLEYHTQGALEGKGTHKKIQKSSLTPNSYWMGDR